MTQDVKALTKKQELDPLRYGDFSEVISLYNHSCSECPISSYAKHPCMTGAGTLPSKGMIVGDYPSVMDDDANYPFFDDAAVYLKNVFSDSGSNLYNFFLTNAVKCYIPKEFKDQKKDVSIEFMKTCTPLYLEEEIRRVKPTVILAMGATAYYYFAHKKGISLNRGVPFYNEEFDCMVMPTFSPRNVILKPDLHRLFTSDVNKFIRMVKGIFRTPTVSIVNVKTYEDFENMMEALEAEPDKPLTFDDETRGFVDARPGYSKVWMLGITNGTRDEEGIISYAMPLEHPQSPFARWHHIPPEDGWGEGNLEGLTCDPYVVKRLLTFILDPRRKLNNHNIKFDIRNLKRMARRYQLHDLV